MLGLGHRFMQLARWKHLAGASKLPGIFASDWREEFLPASKAMKLAMPLKPLRVYLEVNGTQ